MLFPSIFLFLQQLRLFETDYASLMELFFSFNFESFTLAINFIYHNEKKTVYFFFDYNIKPMFSILDLPIIINPDNVMLVEKDVEVKKKF